MRLNHLNLVVTDVQKCIDLFTHYFEFKCAETKGDNIIVILKNEDDFTLVIMSSKENIQYPPAFHIGFMQENIETVNQLYENLKTGVIDVGHVPRKIRDTYGFYFTFDNILIEVGHYINGDKNFL